MIHRLHRGHRLQARRQGRPCLGFVICVLCVICGSLYISSRIGVGLLTRWVGRPCELYRILPGSMPSLAYTVEAKFSGESTRSTAANPFTSVAPTTRPPGVPPPANSTL